MSDQEKASKDATQSKEEFNENVQQSAFLTALENAINPVIANYLPDGNADGLEHRAGIGIAIDGERDASDPELISALTYLQSKGLPTAIARAFTEVLKNDAQINRLLLRGASDYVKETHGQ